MKLELAINAKSGIDFIITASIVWLAIGYLWVGALAIALVVTPDKMFYIPLFISFILVLFVFWLYASNKRKLRSIL